MPHLRATASLIAAILLLGLGSAPAQPNVPQAPMRATPVRPQLPALAPLDGASWRAIRVRNVRPSLLAYWLDPAHNALPAFVNVPYSSRAQLEPMPQQPDEKRAKGPFDLPADAMRLASADEQNLLFVAGGDAQQVEQVQRLVALLDQPIRQVEIEAQFVELPAKEASKFGVDAPGPKNNDDTKRAFQLGFVRGDFQKRLDELAATGKAKILSTTPLTYGNNMGRAVSLRSGPIDNTGANQGKRPQAPTTENDLVLTLTPTINGDETITLMANIETLSQDPNPSRLMTIANLRDGDTIVVAGASPLSPAKTDQLTLSDIPKIGELFRSSQSNKDRVALVFITARIVRQTEE